MRAFPIPTLKANRVFRTALLTAYITGMVVAAAKPTTTPSANASMVGIYRGVFHSISLMPRFTGMRDGAGVGAGAGCAGGAGLNLAMIASRW